MCEHLLNSPRAVTWLTVYRALQVELPDWRTQDERDEEEYLDDLTIKAMEFREECKTIMASQGESKEECYLRFVGMWPQVRDEWHAKRKAAGKFVPNCLRCYRSKCACRRKQC